jgi:hypothetical protein
MGWHGLDWSELRKEQVDGSCECGNEASGSLKCWEVLEWLHNWWPFEQYSVP